MSKSLSHAIKTWLWTLFDASTRTRSLESDMTETTLSRCLKTHHLILYGLGAMSGGSVFGVTIIIFATNAGPATFLSFLLAGFCGFFNSVCYAELAAHMPKAGSAYVFTYLACGELFAFLVGWLMILEYVAQGVLGALGAANTLNVLCNGIIEKGTIAVFGKFPETSSTVLATYPNFVAAAMTLVFIIILCTGAESSVLVTNLAMILTGVLMITSIVFMISHSHGLDYLSEPLHGGFAPFGIAGVFVGAGVAVNSFNGFDVISISAEEAENPRRSIPLAMNTSVIIMIIVLTIFSFVLATYVPWYDVDPQKGLTGIFDTEGYIWLKYVSGVTTIVGYMTNSLCSLYAAPRVVYALANDGLLFPALRSINPQTQIPLTSTILCGTVAFFLSICLDFVELAKMLSVGSLIAFTLVAAVTISLRYTSPEVYVQRDKHFIHGKWQKLQVQPKVGEFYPLQGLQGSCLDDFPPGRLIKCAVASLVLLTFLMELAILRGIPYIMKHQQWWILPLIMVVITLYVMNIMFILTCRYQRHVSFYSLPGFPYTPFIAIVVNVSLMVEQTMDVWSRILIWSLFGIIIYYVYGVWHSNQNSTFVHIPHPFVDSEFASSLFDTLRSKNIYPQEKGEMGKHHTKDT